jgi:hypothetical protein
LNAVNQVDALWAGSPADKAGLTCGEMLWSLEENAKRKQPVAELEAGLASLTGSLTLYVVTTADWTKALNSGSPGHGFNPVRRKVLLTL